MKISTTQQPSKQAPDAVGISSIGLPTMAASAGSIGLRSAILHHVAQTVQYGRRVEAILRRHGTRLKPGHDQLAAALVRKVGEIMWELSDRDLWGGSPREGCCIAWPAPAGRLGARPEAAAAA